MEIVPVENVRGSHKTGSLYSTTIEQINEMLGFEPNKKGSADMKVVNCWNFTVFVENVGECECSIWDWKGSQLANTFSTYGDHFIFSELFGARYYSAP